LLLLLHFSVSAALNSEFGELHMPHFSGLTINNPGMQWSDRQGRYKPTGVFGIHHRKTNY